MKILYDGSIYNRSIGRPFGGIARYFKHLIEGLPPEVSAVIALNEVNPPIYPVSRSLKTVCFSARNVRPWRLGKAAEDLFGAHNGKFIQADLAHPTNHLALDGKPVRRGKRPLVFTVYDMLHELYPATMDPEGKFGREKEIVIRQADVILAISETTRQDLHRIHGVPLERIIVTYLAGDLGHSATIDAAPRLHQEPYLLYVGDRKQGYKNFAILPKVLRAQGPGALPCVAVGPDWTAAERVEYADLLAAGKLIAAGQVDDDQLAVLYRDAEAFIYPSFYEGFGIPPVESMLMGAPVIASTGGSIPEVLGDAALLFDPQEPEELLAHIQLIQNKPATREGLIQRGSERARGFTWEHTVAGTMKAYQSLL